MNKLTELAVVCLCVYGFEVNERYKTISVERKLSQTKRGGALRQRRDLLLVRFIIIYV